MLKIHYGSDTSSYNQTISQLANIEKKIKDLQKNNIIKYNINKQQKNPQDNISNSLALNHIKLLSTISKSLLKLIPMFSAFTGAISVVSALKQNNVTAGVLDELNWQQTRSKTAFRYMNVASQSNLVNENDVASEIQKIMQQQREFKTTGIASDTRMQAMMAQFGLSLGDNIETILTKLDKRRKTMGSKEYYTYMQQVGLNNIARAQIESEKVGKVPQLYSMERSEKTAKLTRSYNRFATSMKDSAFQILEASIPLLEKFMTTLTKTVQTITPPITQFISTFNKTIEDMPNISDVKKNIEDKKKQMGIFDINSVSIADIPGFFLNVLKEAQDRLSFGAKYINNATNNTNITYNNQQQYNQQRYTTNNNNNNTSRNNYINDLNYT